MIFQALPFGLTWQTIIQAVLQFISQNQSTLGWALVIGGVALYFISKFSTALAMPLVILGLILVIAPSLNIQSIAPPLNSTANAPPLWQKGSIWVCPTNMWYNITTQKCLCLPGTTTNPNGGGCK